MKRKQVKPERQRAPKDENYDGSTPLPDPKQELFCDIFTTNTLPRFWANGQHSYEFAYGYTDRIQKVEDEIDEIRKLTLQPKSKRKGKSLAGLMREIEAKKEEIKKMNNTCRACAPVLLARPSIKKRCGYLLDKLATHLIVDRELTYLIQQRDDNTVKMSAIAHHDKREQRIRERIDIKHEFEPITGFDYVRPEPKQA